MIKNFKNKKGNIADMLLVGVGFFIILVVLIALKVVLTNMNTGFTDSGEFDQSSLDIIQREDARFGGLWDKSLAFFMLALATFTWISAFFIRSHPVFFIFGFFLIVIFVFVFAVLSDAYVVFADTPELRGAVAEFPVSDFILRKLPFFILGLSIITAIITYIKGGEPTF